MSTSDPSAERPRENFIYDIIDEDLDQGTYGDRVVTRFPPEPNGHLHIGHAKSIVLNFGIKHDYADRADTQCHLRFDDTNPKTESPEYVESIKDAVNWLGYDWEDHEYHASDYFEQFYRYAITLIKQGDAYVDSLSEEKIREYRGTVDEPGTPSPYRDRSVEENLELFRKMKAGEFEDGEHVLRAKIDMSSPHMIMRDPLLFRILHAPHYRRGDEWCLYPMYDYAHPLEDAIEDVTHSLCTLEFDNNRRVYDWVMEHCLDADEIPARPRQYEFNRLNLGYTVMSKTKLRHLIEEDLVDGWDDPRLPTISGLRRRGVPPSAIRSFCREVGVTRSQSRVQIGHFEHALRDDLNPTAPRVMAVLDPLKVVVTNWDEDEVDWINANHWPRDIDKDETRPVPFAREFYIERGDFREDPPEDFIRLAPGREVRLRHAYFFTCEEVVRDEDGTVTELRGTIDPDTRDSTAPDGRSPDGTLHWVSAAHGIPFEARLYDRLFGVPDPDAREDHFTEFLNPDSLNVRQGVLEPAVRDLDTDQRVQFERQGYFWADPDTSRPDALVYNQIVPLRDTWGGGEEGLTQEELAQQRREKEQRKEEQRRRSLEGKTDPAEHLDDAQRDRFTHFHDELGIDREDAATMAGDDALADFFEQALEHYDAPEPLANWTVNELLGRLNDRTVAALPLGPGEFADLVRLVDTEVISTRGADEVFHELVENGGDPEAIVDARDLRQVDDTEALRPTIQAVLGDHPDEVARYRDGKKGLIGFFMGQVMQATDGAANPELARTLLQEELEPTA
ncbi:glutamine--tRNA ligase/YqeY domain fusion protein [Salinibacter altiplanensis]|uniref:glutamine--tRNA ligase/YqeY domain fusion protein n=1 Tax=Salinibacter altiplanensis TaxID=1803181 RepID=UPI000C9F1A08|nr:glutamine--tRNA ligase/YqeY domain fusion protein [Salinibacter altiplanensis]